MEQFDKISHSEIEIDKLLGTIDDLYRMEKGNEKDERESDAEQKDSSEPKITEKMLQEKGFVESQIQEIMLGISQQLPVYALARDCYNWKQIREIRLGLLEGIETAVYENPLFSAEQMHEIRLGLIDGLDVSSYAKLLYTATDMGNMRRKLMAEIYQMNPNGFGKEIVDEDTGARVRISDNCMEAYLTVTEYGELSVYDLKKILSRNEVVHGVRMEALEKMMKEKPAGEEVLVAKGEPDVPGRNGRFDYFFNKLLPESPRVQDNGNVDYTEVVVADSVEKGEVLAKYHPSTVGRSGETVTGIFLEGKRGKDLPPLMGQGIARDAEKDVYTATSNGFVALDEVQNSLNVWNIFVVDGDVNRYNGHITYDGTIHIKGSVSDMAEIVASGDVIVDGFIEGANISAGGNIILKRGVNAGGEGLIKAGGKVMGNFFEYASIEARGRIEGNYFMDCNAKTDNILFARGSKAKIIGGEIRAGRAVESITIGNNGKVKTVIDVGNTEWIDKKLSHFWEIRERVQDEIHQLEEGKEKMRTLLGTKMLEKNDLFKKTCMALQVKEEQKIVLEREIEYYKKVRKDSARAYVKAAGKLQEGVVVFINGARKEIQKTVSGITLKRTTE